MLSFKPIFSLSSFTFIKKVQETWVQSLGQEDPLEKEMVTHAYILAWEIPWSEEPGGLYCPWGSKSQT